MIVTVQNHGTFEIPNEKAQELVNWLTQANAVKINEQNNNHTGDGFGGKELLNG